MKTLNSSVAVLLVSGLVNLAFAVEYPDPVDRVIESSNGKYLLKVDADTHIHEICEVLPDGKGKQKVLWSFKRDVWHNAYVLSNDGKRVLWIAHPNFHVRREEFSAMIYTADGVVWKRTVFQLSNPQPSRKAGVKSTWRKGVTTEGARTTIQVLGNPPLVIDMNNPPLNS